MRRRSTLCFQLAHVGCLAAVVGCSSAPPRTQETGAPTAEASERDPLNSAVARNEQPADSKSSGPVTPEPSPELVEGPPVDAVADSPGDLSPPSGPGASGDAAPTPAPVEADRPAVRRPDGRPNWWLDAPLITDGRTTVTAEALGRDVRSAIRAAVDAGRRALTERLSVAPVDERIEVSTVRALAAPAGGESSARYVGYVRMSGRPPGARDNSGR